MTLVIAFNKIIDIVNAIHVVKHARYKCYQSHSKFY